MYVDREAGDHSNDRPCQETEQKLEQGKMYVDNAGGKTISSQTVVDRGDPTHLLLGPTNVLQVADQSLLALLQSLLQVLEGCTYLSQGLCLAFLQLLADAPNQGDSCR